MTSTENSRLLTELAKVAGVSRFTVSNNVRILAEVLDADETEAENFRSEEFSEEVSPSILEAGELMKLKASERSASFNQEDNHRLDVGGRV